MDKRELSDTLQHMEELCNKRGARLTSHRRTVLGLLYDSNKPLSAYEILDKMRSNTSNPAPPVVYRALNFLLKQGLIHKLESLHAFMACSHPEHPHSSQFLICDDCGEVCEIENREITQSLQSAERVAGFKTKRPVVEFLGTCSQCLEPD